MTILTSYHNSTFDHTRREKIVAKVCKKLKKYPEEVGLVFTGLSGMLVGIPVAAKTKRPFAIVRKPHDSKHASFVVEGYKFKSFIIIDDFSESGGTIERILAEMKTERGGKCKGIIMYDGNSCGSGRKSYNKIPIYNL